MLDEFCIEKLVELVSWKNFECFSKNPRLYIRIFLILMCYSGYNSLMPLSYFKAIEDLGRNVIAFENFYEENKEIRGFNNSQLK